MTNVGTSLFYEISATSLIKKKFPGIICYFDHKQRRNFILTANNVCEKMMFEKHEVNAVINGGLLFNFRNNGPDKTDRQ